jgi:hypothetical protein
MAASDYVPTSKYHLRYSGRPQMGSGMSALGQPKGTMQLTSGFIIKDHMPYEGYYRDKREEGFHYHRARWKYFKNVYDRDRNTKQQNQIIRRGPAYTKA